ncbi:MAG: ATP-dependent DNA helicase, partial [Proteobacteria bacterium]|nr:ATP-dependent DNA helicase [Pseudomonadota bacterium]
MASPPTIRPVRLPDAPALVAGPTGAVLLSQDGELTEFQANEAERVMAGTTPIVCHGRSTAHWLSTSAFPTYDILELFAFVRPAQFCIPTARGVAQTLGLEVPETPEDIAASLFSAATVLLGELSDAQGTKNGPPTREIAMSMAQAQWPWGRAVLAALPDDPGPGNGRERATGLRIWQRLGEWSDHAPQPAPGHYGVEAEETADRLAEMLGGTSENRPSQRDYANTARKAFAPADATGEPHVMVAEAGTGIGKTVGYLAPASLWAQKNDGAVWISTYTRNLQRQLDGELNRLYPDPVQKALKAVVRKGRENYLCLLNFEESVGRLSLRREDAIALGLV